MVRYRNITAQQHQHANVAKRVGTKSLGKEAWKEWTKFLLLFDSFGLFSDFFLLLVTEIPVCQDGGGGHGPDVQGDAEPGGDDLDPHGARVRLEGGQVGARAGKQSTTIRFT